MIDQDRLLRTSKIVAFATVTVVVIGVFVRMMYGGDPTMPKTLMYGGEVGMMGPSDSEGWSSGVAGSSAPSSEAPMMKNVPLGAPEAVSSRMMALDSSEALPAEGGSEINKKVIRTGSLRLRVDDADWSVGEIARIAVAAGGSIDSSDISDNGEGVKSGTVTVKVPVAKFEESFDELRRAGRVVLNQSQSGTDVTEQVIDIEARIKNKQAEEEAYANILKVQTQKISDILEVTRAINQVRGEIESLTAQLKYLNSQSDMSTISIYLSEDPAIGQTQVWRPIQVVKDAVNMLIVKLQKFADFVIELVIVVLPTFLLYLLVLWIIYLAGRGIYRKLRQ